MPVARSRTRCSRANTGPTTWGRVGVANTGEINDEHRPHDEGRARLTIYKAAQMLSHPNVSMIDIGQDPNNVASPPVLRVHVRPSDVSGLDIPNDVDGIPVRVFHGDYRPATQPEERPQD
jgi:hypothetical protein